jgi:hypothetical protein
MSDNKEKTFMTSLKDMLRNTFTGKDNQTLDLGRLLWAKGVFVYFGLTVYDLYNNGKFDAMDWATGLGIVLAAGGAALAMKAKTEPEQPPASKK